MLDLTKTNFFSVFFCKITQHNRIILGFIFPVYTAENESYLVKNWDMKALIDEPQVRDKRYSAIYQPNA
jgi:hypothetical protein